MPPPSLCAYQGGRDRRLKTPFSPRRNNGRETFRETDMRELVRNTLDSYRYQIEQHGFTYEESHPGPPGVTACLADHRVSRVTRSAWLALFVTFA